METPKMVGVIVPACGRLGSGVAAATGLGVGVFVGEGDGVAVGQIQSVSPVHEAFLHIPLEQIKLFSQSLLLSHD